MVICTFKTCASSMEDSSICILKSPARRNLAYFEYALKANPIGSRKKFHKLGVWNGMYQQVKVYFSLNLFIEAKQLCLLNSALGMSYLF